MYEVEPCYLKLRPVPCGMFVEVDTPNNSNTGIITSQIRFNCILNRNVNESMLK